MPPCQKAVRPMARCLQNAPSLYLSARSIRTFTSSTTFNAEAAAQEAAPSGLDPATVVRPENERKLMRQGIMPIGSRRRRAALKTSANIPFEQLPYQCFQEARKVLQADREEKLEMIAKERLRLKNLEAQDASASGGEKQKQTRIESIKRYLEYLKIQADINDPLIKKRFEDGEGDMNKPIYRYLADRKWREYQRKIIVQRLQQFSIVPDLLPHFEPTAEVRLAFQARNVQPGDYVDSRVSEFPARLKVQVFDKGERLVSVVVVDADVPNVENDHFNTRCHYLAANIPISPVQDSLPLSRADPESQLILPWLPPFAQKGSPYHRYSIFVLEQKPGQVLDVAALKELYQRDRFNLRGFKDRHDVQPIGLGLFRSEWDEGTKGVMQRAGIEGWDIEFKRTRIPALKPKQKARGWEARHASDKYKSLRR
ncbi:putative ribosomal protein 35 protein [Botrytis fragariae]|uniref:Large ribosomal subunit protein mL38 n=1 Tax=Botrytis fragariae TaxID=1964551 RepID=A0A8H6B129_9HELO|nr:putative ribosomal protein 35 protein [Botrytis fragariae]KAF5877493.1 putative ribosomal protein 35 protein [Botrytis fragariae]